jgi:hypothetical protein
MELTEQSLADGGVVGNTKAILEVPKIIAALEVRRTTRVVGRVEGIRGVGGFNIVKYGIRKCDV